MAWATVVSPETRPASRAPSSQERASEPLLQVDDLLADRLEAEVPRLDDSRMDRPDGDLVDPFTFGPDPPVRAFDARHPRCGSEALAQRPGIRRPILVLDPGARVGVPHRDHPHEAAHLPLEAPGGDEFPLDGRKGRVVHRDIAFHQQEFRSQVIAGIDAEASPEKGLVGGPFRHEAGIGVFHRPRRLVELLPRDTEQRDVGRIETGTGTGGRAELRRYLRAEHAHFSNPTAAWNQSERKRGR